MLSLTGEIQLDRRSDAEVRAIELQLSSALQERFTRVQVADDAITASGNLLDLVFRGSRTHPMLPFNAARFQFAADDQAYSLRYSLDLKFFIVGFIYLGLASGLLASVDRGFQDGMFLGFLFSFIFLILNFAVAMRRAKRWMLENLGLR